MRPPHYPRGPRRAAPDGCPPRTQASGPRVLSPVSLPRDRPASAPSRRPRPAAWPHLPYLVPGFSPMVRAPAARRPPGSRLARSLPACCQVPAPPRATAHARPPLFLLSPAPPAPLRSWGTGPSCVSPDRARRGTARPLGADCAVIGSAPAPAPPRPRPAAPGAGAGGDGGGGLVSPERADPSAPLGPPISPPSAPP